MLLLVFDVKNMPLSQYFDMGGFFVHGLFEKGFPAIEISGCFY